MKELDKTIFEKRFEYHIEQTRQRWQYFAVNLVLQGALLNIIISLSQKELKDLVLIKFICLVGIISNLTFVVLIGRSRRRIRLNAEKVNKLAKQNILETGKQKTFGFSGVSIWLILTTLLFIFLWGYILLVFKGYWIIAICIIPLIYILGTTELLHDWTFFGKRSPRSTKTVSKKQK